MFHYNTKTIKLAEEFENMCEFMDNNPSCLAKYMDRHPHLLDAYVKQNCDEYQVEQWLQAVSEPPPTEVLKLGRVDLKKEENETAHKTDMYVNSDVVLRRGQTVKLDLHFNNREYLPAKDKVFIVFSIGSKPSPTTDTLYKLEVNETSQRSHWDVILLDMSEDGKCMHVEVNIPADAIIGRYNVAVEIKSETEAGVQTSAKHQPDVIVLFNPFCPQDDVYLPDEAHQKEYVLNDEGIIYYGSVNRIGGMNWLFGQFEEGILGVALKLLREEPNSKKNPMKSIKKRSSPVQCARILSAMVNCGDDDGVLWGNWSGDYSGGAKPTSWSGSVKILQEWSRNKMAPVKFGQCWVFSGVFTTVLRALGIPARSVTNFNSAHDTEFNMVIDKFIDEEGEEVDYSSDSIWNFHVWNEAWFKRRDLPKGYDGWQAVDATPQEESGGIMRCGPAPLKAIKEGEIFVGQDTNFLFGEVNADRVYWKVNKDSEVTGIVKRQTRHVGRNISTKACGSDRREDLTSQYKHPEGSEEERAAFDRAYAHGRKAPYHDKFVIEEEGAVTVDITPASEDVAIGSDVNVAIKVTNTTTETKTVTINTVVCSMLNTDERKAILKTIKKQVTLDQASESHSESISLGYSDYGSRLSDCSTIRFTTTVRVEESGNLYVERYDLRLETPDCVTIQIDDQLVKRKYGEVKFSITNPLSVPLTGGVLTLQGSGLSITSDDTIQIRDPIPPGATITSPPFEVRPYRTSVTLMADFDSNEVANLKCKSRVSVRSY